MSAQSYIVAASLLIAVMLPASASAQEIAKGSENYQALIRKNFGLRGELQALEEKYRNLENERKVLIIHVKELQDAKSQTEDKIQELKNMVASLRIEMLKDPKLTGRIEGLNRRIEDAAQERDQLRAKVEELEAEKKSFEQKRDEGLEQARQARAKNEELVKEVERLRSGYSEDEVKLKKGLSGLELEKQDLAKKNQDLQRDLDAARRSLGQEEKSLKAELEKARGEKNSLEEKIHGMLEEKEAARLSYAQSEDGLKAQLKEKEEEIGLLKRDIGQVDDKIARFQAEAEQAENKAREMSRKLDVQQSDLAQQRQALDAKILGMEERNKQLMKDLEQERALLSNAEGKWQDKVRDAQMENSRFEKNLAKTASANASLNQKLAGLEQEVKESGDVNRRLMKDLKKEQAALEKSDKALKLEAQKREIEREAFDARLRNTMKDKAMLEASLAQMEERVLAAETRREKAIKLAGEDSAMLGLRDSEVAALREAKSRLEAKLLHYIEKNIARSQGWQSPLSAQWSEEPDAAGATPEHAPPRKMTRAQKIKTRMDIAEKKLKMHYNLALAYDRMGMYREEEREYRKCLKLNPKDANAHYNLAILYDDKLGRNDKAIHHYQRYLELRPQGEESEWVKNWILYAEQERRLSTKVK